MSYNVHKTLGYEDREKLEERLRILGSLIANNVIQSYPGRVVTEFYKFDIFQSGVLAYIEDVYKNYGGLISPAYGIFLQDIIDCLLSNKTVNFSKYSYMLEEPDTNNCNNTNHKINQPLKLNIPTGHRLQQNYDGKDLYRLLGSVGPEGVLAILRLITRFEQNAKV